MHLNPFPVPSPLQRSLLAELVQVAQSCYQRGWSYGTAGNFSLRGHARTVWQSPTALNKGQLNPEHFVAIDLESGAPISPTSSRASLESPVHLAILRAIPRARAVVHTHPSGFVRHTSSMIHGGGQLQFAGHEMQKALGQVDHLAALTLDILPNPRPDQLGVASTAFLSKTQSAPQVVCFAGHGIYAWGETPMAALVKIEAIEYLCQTAL